MIDYINHQLNLWAEWLRTGNTRLGYPTRAAFVAAMGGGRGAQITLPDDQAMDINRAVGALAPELRAVVERYYRSMRTASAEVIAQDLGCSRDTVYVRLHRAHVFIMEHLQDQEIDRKSPMFASGG